MGSEMCIRDRIGGETAEMPKVYSKDDFDIAGFSVGIIDKKDLLPKKNISSNDCVIGIKSTGFHSNGYSLLNNMLDKKKIKLNELVGKKIWIGNVKTEVVDLCRPCKHLEEKLNKNNIIKEFLRKGGIRCHILSSSQIKIGDTIKLND